MLEKLKDFSRSVVQLAKDKRNKWWGVNLSDKPQVTATPAAVSVEPIMVLNDKDLEVEKYSVGKIPGSNKSNRERGGDFADESSPDSESI
jgi:hypothetical protein